MEEVSLTIEKSKNRINDVLLWLASEISQSDPKKVQIKLNRLCRVCLSRSCTNLSSCINIDGTSISILEILSSLTDVDFIFDDIMSKTICSRCVQIVKKFYNFKRQCEDVDRKMRQILNMTDSLSDDTYLKLNNPENENSVDNVRYGVNEKETNTKKTFKFVNVENLLINTDQKKDKLKYTEIADEASVDSDTFDDRSSFFDATNDTIEDSLGVPPKKRTHFKYKIQLKQHMKEHDNKKKNVPESDRKGDKTIETLEQRQTDKSYICSICEKGFISSIRLSNHLKIHSKELNYFCDYCLKGFVMKYQLILHMRKQHAIKKPYLCSYENCNKTFASIYNLKEHIRMHRDPKSYACSTCGRVFSSMSIKNKHEKGHVCQKYVCSWENCNRSFRRKKYYTLHLSTHFNGKQILCSHCGKSMATASDLKRHTLTHTQEKPFKCTQCDKGFNLQYGLTLHMRYHEGKACFVCDTCGKGYMRKSILVKHMLCHLDIKKYKCEYCNKRFTVADHLVRHKRTHTGERPFKCEICEKGFSTRSGCVSHTRTHMKDKPYKCKHCEKSFVSSTVLKIHSVSHGERPYVCPHCNASFNRSDYKNLHVKTCINNLSRNSLNKTKTDLNIKSSIKPSSGSINMQLNKIKHEIK